MIISTASKHFYIYASFFSKAEIDCVHVEFSKHLTNFSGTLFFEKNRMITEYKRNVGISGLTVHPDKLNQLTRTLNVGMVLRQSK